jgi:hypothetical protein
LRIPIRSVVLLVALGIAALIIALLNISGLPVWAQIFVFYAIVFGVVWGLSFRRAEPPLGQMLAVVMPALVIMAAAGGVHSPWDQVFLTAGLVWFVAGWFYIRRRMRSNAGRGPISD